MTLVSLIILSSVISQGALQAQVLIVRALLIKIVENQEAQIIPIGDIDIFLLILYIYLIHAGRYSYTIGQSNSKSR